MLSKIPNWNQEIITAETERIVSCSKCDFLDDLITAVFISHTKILTSIGPNKNECKVNLKIPKTDNFIHKPTNIEHDKQKVVGHIASAGYSEFGSNKLFKLGASFSISACIFLFSVIIFLSLNNINITI